MAAAARWAPWATMAAARARRRGGGEGAAAREGGPQQPGPGRGEAQGPVRRRRLLGRPAGGAQRLGVPRRRPTGAVDTEPELARRAVPVLPEDAPADPVDLAAQRPLDVGPQPRPFPRRVDRSAGHPPPVAISETD